MQGGIIVNNKFNSVSIDSLCAALCEIIGVEPPKNAAKACSELTEYASKVFNGEKADRVLMYNPDAIAEWIYRKYPILFAEVTDRTDLQLPLRTVMPSVTPVCFGTMYTGVQPEVHGITTYAKPVLKIETIFDALIKAGKKPVIIAEKNSSISKIFLERDMDYFIYDEIEDVDAKTFQILLEDKYDFIVVYNGNYDALMHRYGPESIEALCEARVNAEAYTMFDSLIKENLSGHRWLLGFAMDHGAHEIDGGCGSHGLEMPEDLNILHLYKAYDKK